MNRILTILVVFLLLNSPGKVRAQHTGAPPKKHSSSYKKQTISYKLINVKNHAYGYDIFINGSLFIHQPIIPGISGNKGFKTKTDAKKVAVIAIEKIKKGIIPPAITISEMQKLRIDLK